MSAASLVSYVIGKLKSDEAAPLGDMSELGRNAPTPQLTTVWRTKSIPYDIPDTTRPFRNEGSLLKLLRTKSMPLLGIDGSSPQRLQAAPQHAQAPARSQSPSPVRHQAGGVASARNMSGHFSDASESTVPSMNTPPPTPRSPSPPHARQRSRSASDGHLWQRRKKHVRRHTDKVTVTLPSVKDLRGKFDDKAAVSSTDKQPPASSDPADDHAPREGEAGDGREGRRVSRHYSMLRPQLKSPERRPPPRQAVTPDNVRKILEKFEISPQIEGKEDEVFSRSDSQELRSKSRSEVVLKTSVTEVPKEDQPRRRTSLQGRQRMKNHRRSKSEPDPSAVLRHHAQTSPPSVKKLKLLFERETQTTAGDNDLTKTSAPQRATPQQRHKENTAEPPQVLESRGDAAGEPEAEENSVAAQQLLDVGDATGQRQQHKTPRVVEVLAAGTPSVRSLRQRFEEGTSVQSSLKVVDEEIVSKPRRAIAHQLRTPFEESLNQKSRSVSPEKESRHSLTSFSASVKNLTRQFEALSPEMPRKAEQDGVGRKPMAPLSPPPTDSYTKQQMLPLDSVTRGAQHDAKPAADKATVEVQVDSSWRRRSRSNSSSSDSSSDDEKREEESKRQQMEQQRLRKEAENEKDRQRIEQDQKLLRETEEKMKIEKEIEIMRKEKEREIREKEKAKQEREAKEKEERERRILEIIEKEREAKKKLEEERKIREREEQERLAREQQERLAKEKQERLAREQQERLAREEQERLAREQQERLEKEEEEKRKLLEEKRKEKEREELEMRKREREEKERKERERAQEERKEREKQKKEMEEKAEMERRERERVEREKAQEEEEKRKKREREEAERLRLLHEQQEEEKWKEETKRRREELIRRLSGEEVPKGAEHDEASENDKKPDDKQSGSSSSSVPLGETSSEPRVEQLIDQFTNLRDADLEGDSRKGDPLRLGGDDLEDGDAEQRRHSDVASLVNKFRKLNARRGSSSSSESDGEDDKPRTKPVKEEAPIPTIPARSSGPGKVRTLREDEMRFFESAGGGTEPFLRTQSLRVKKSEQSHFSQQRFGSLRGSKSNKSRVAVLSASSATTAALPGNCRRLNSDELQFFTGEVTNIYRNRTTKLRDRGDRGGRGDGRLPKASRGGALPDTEEFFRLAGRAEPGGEPNGRPAANDNESDSEPSVLRTADEVFTDSESDIYELDINLRSDADTEDPSDSEGRSDLDQTLSLFVHSIQGELLPPVATEGCEEAQSRCYVVFSPETHPWSSSEDEDDTLEFALASPSLTESVSAPPVKENGISLAVHILQQEETQSDAPDAALLPNTPSCSTYTQQQTSNSHSEGEDNTPRPHSQHYTTEKDAKALQGLDFPQHSGAIKENEAGIDLLGGTTADLRPSEELKGLVLTGLVTAETGEIGSREADPHLLTSEKKDCSEEKKVEKKTEDNEVKMEKKEEDNAKVEIKEEISVKEEERNVKMEKEEIVDMERKEEDNAKKEEIKEKISVKEKEEERDVENMEEKIVKVERKEENYAMKIEINEKITVKEEKEEESNVKKKEEEVIVNKVKEEKEVTIQIIQMEKKDITKAEKEEEVTVKKTGNQEQEVNTKKQNDEEPDPELIAAFLEELDRINAPPRTIPKPSTRRKESKHKHMDEDDTSSVTNSDEEDDTAMLPEDLKTIEDQIIPSASFQQHSSCIKGPAGSPIHDNDPSATTEDLKDMGTSSEDTTTSLTTTKDLSIATTPSGTQESVPIKKVNVQDSQAEEPDPELIAAFLEELDRINAPPRTIPKPSTRRKESKHKHMNEDDTSSVTNSDEDDEDDTAMLPADLRTIEEQIIPSASFQQQSSCQEGPSGSPIHDNGPSTTGEDLKDTETPSEDSIASLRTAKDLFIATPHSGSYESEPITDFTGALKEGKTGGESHTSPLPPLCTERQEEEEMRERGNNLGDEERPSSESEDIMTGKEFIKFCIFSLWFSLVMYFLSGILS